MKKNDETKGAELPAVRGNETRPVNPNPSDELVAAGQASDPATPEALDKDGPSAGVTAPGEAEAGAEKQKYRATGNFLVFDPYTLDSVGVAGGEMRVTQFVRDKVAEGKLEEI